MTPWRQPARLLKRRMRGAAYRLLHGLTGQGRGVRVILLYHSVGSAGPYSVPHPAFEEQMRLLAGRFTVVPLRDLRRVMAAAPQHANLACVTFDDGYHDNYERALPVLERLGLKATFFVASGFMGGRFPTRFGVWPMMTPAQVAECASLGHEIGAHSVNHPRLTALSPEAVRDEVGGSKRALEHLVSREVMSFSYPKGDWNTAVREVVNSAGFACAVTTREGLVGGEPDWLVLPRVRIGGRMNAAAFEARVSPAARLVGRL